MDKSRYELETLAAAVRHAKNLLESEKLRALLQPQMLTVKEKYTGSENHSSH
jgi:hypothetical protein